MVIGAGVLAAAACFIILLIIGPVRLSINEILEVLTGGTPARQQVKTIILQIRMPMAIGAACSGAMLSVAGLMMQTYFHNPLAGPSVLGISSGASFGVALFFLSAGGLGATVIPGWQPVVSTVSAFGGALATIFILYLFSSVIKSGVTLLIVGIMLSYLFSSGISLLNYFSTADEIRTFYMWGLGSFSGLRMRSALWFLILSVLILAPTLWFAKPLNAMLLGERYMQSVGYSTKSMRAKVLVLSGLLVAVPTAFCGPIGFIGLVVPHFCRLLLRSSNHLVLIPASIVIGAAVMMLCAIAGILPASRWGVLPINVITPIVGVPVILFLLVRRNRLLYF